MATHCKMGCGLYFWLINFNELPFLIKAMYTSGDWVVRPRMIGQRFDYCGQTGTASKILQFHLGEDPALPMSFGKGKWR